MWFIDFKLIKKKKLTPDVFELVFQSVIELDIVPWKFMTFMLPKTWFARAYSVLFKEWKNIYFIIKRLENWRWGSKEICDYEEGKILKWVWPTGHFVDSKKDVSKLFISTGTWMVPLYFMIRNLLENWYNKNLKLVLWNREEKDLYYLDEFRDFKEKYPNFDVEIFLSREQKDWFQKWYVWDFLTSENISKFEEYYICWNPNMVEEVEEKLLNFWIQKENIFREKF